MARILSEARKYRLGLTLARQHLAQLDEQVQEAVLGNVGTIITFRVGPEDAGFHSVPVLLSQADFDLS